MGSFLRNVSKMTSSNAVFFFLSAFHLSTEEKQCHHMWLAAALGQCFQRDLVLVPIRLYGHQYVIDFCSAEQERE